MNRMFRIIWSTALGAWVVASERATLRGKSGGNGGNGGGSRAMLASASERVRWRSAAGRRLLPLKPTLGSDRFNW